MPNASFHVMVHPRFFDEKPGPDWTCAEKKYRTLAVSPNQLTHSFGLGLEAATARLSQLDRLFIEGDGSFVWVGPTDSAWQIDGNLYDRQEKLFFIELKVSCSSEEIERLFAALQIAGETMMFQIVRAGVFLPPEEFYRLLDQA